MTSMLITHDIKMNIGLVAKSSCYPLANLPIRLRELIIFGNPERASGKRAVLSTWLGTAAYENTLWSFK